MIPPLHTPYSQFMSDLRFAIDAGLGDGAWRFMTLVVFNIWRGGSFVSIAPTPSGQGVWILDSKGNLLSFGDATELRSVRSSDDKSGR